MRVSESSIQSHWGVVFFVCFLKQDEADRAQQMLKRAFAKFDVEEIKFQKGN